MNTLFFLSCLLFATFVYSQIETEFIHPLTNIPESSDDIETRAFFPHLLGSSGDNRQTFLAGENVLSLCHFTNTGDSPYNVTAIMGSLNSPMDFSFYIQNYTYQPVGLTLGSNEEISLEYNFEPHKTLPANDYQLSITVFYENESERFAVTYYNETISVTQPEPETDAEAVMVVLGGLGLMFATIYAVLVFMFPNSKASQNFFNDTPKKAGKTRRD